MLDLANIDIVMISRVVLVLTYGGCIFWMLSVLLLCIKLDEKTLWFKNLIFLLIMTAILFLAWFDLLWWELLGIAVISILFPFFASREKRRLSFALSSMGLLLFLAGQAFFFDRDTKDTFLLFLEGNYVSAFAPSILAVLAVWLSAASVFFLAIKLKKQDKQICT